MSRPEREHAVGTVAGITIGRAGKDVMVSLGGQAVYLAERERDAFIRYFVAAEREAEELS